MTSFAESAEPIATRQVFETWSIQVPAWFAETFVEDDAYWHGWDEHRSVSMTSMLVWDHEGPVSADRIVEHLLPMDGDPVEELPPGLVGWAVYGTAIPPARASRTLSGMLAADGRVLAVTITSDDLGWARRTWRSIRWHPVAAPSRRERRSGRTWRH